MAARMRELRRRDSCLPGSRSSLTPSAREVEDEPLPEQEEIQAAGLENRLAAPFPQMREPYLR
jgi:hypothetical protein